MAAMPVRPRGREGFHIAIICALSLEAEMVELMLDKDWSDHGPSFGKAIGDTNVYTTGVLSGHNVVLCYMSGMGGNTAAACAASLRISFPNVEIAFVVGICGVVPKDSRTGEDILLGDCIISTAVTQYDFGRQYPDGFSAKTSVDDSLSRASGGIRAAISKLQTRINRRKLTDKLLTHFRYLQQNEADIRYPGIDKDRLFRSDYDHGQHSLDKCCIYCSKATPGACSKDCAEIQCDQTFTVSRTGRNPTGCTDGQNLECNPKIHFGRIGSANMVVKAGIFRDKIAKQLDVIAFEMEGAGTWDILPTIVVKGACDYADSHKNKEWQKYAAAAAASCLKAIVTNWESLEPKSEIIKSGSLGKRKVAEFLAQDDFVTTQEELVIAQETSINKPQNSLTKWRERILKELYFANANSRVNNVKNGHSATCHWLIEHKTYLGWLDNSQYDIHHAILWIKGKAGSGKSTIMKYILTEAINSREKQQAKQSEQQAKKNKQQAKQNKQQEVIISFFFNARGTDLEKTTLGLYRSLLVQLLNQVPEMQEILDNESLTGPAHEYTLETLESIFYFAMQWVDRQHQEGKHNIRVLCFIDALDECLEDQIRNMLRLFERIKDIGMLHDGRVLFRVCFSSRYYPNISMKYGQELMLDRQSGHLDDIRKYIDAELRLRWTTEDKMIKDEIIEKSGRVFLWVVLVVQILIKEYDRGRVHNMRKKLTEIPNELNELFKDIILRDQENMEEFTLCIQWLLYTGASPMAVDELYFAMLWEIDPTSMDSMLRRNIDQEELQHMRRYVLNSSKGLVEFVQSESGMGFTHNGSTSTVTRVQFIHESVREFFMKEQALVNSWIGTKSIEAGISHDRLKTICQKQLSSPIRSPLQRYAVLNILQHANEACSYGISQFDFLENFPRQKWIREKWLNHQLPSTRYTLSASLLYILAHLDLPYLIRQELVRDPTCNQSGDEDYELPIYVALSRYHTAAVMELLKPAPDAQTDLDMYKNAIYSACKTIRSRTTQGGNRPRCGQSPISYFVEHRLDDLVHLLLSCKGWVESQYTIDMLDAATKSRNVDLVERLLDRKDIQGDIYDYEGCTPLYVAAREGYTEIVQCFFTKNAAIENGLATLETGETPLHVATRNGHEDVFHILLDNNVDFRATNHMGFTALHLAAYKDSRSMAQRLLRLGSSLEALTNNGWLPFHIAAFYGSLNILDLLLSPVVLVDTPTTAGNYTALWLAARNGHRAVVQWLIERNAKIELTVNGDRPPLHAAIASGSHGTVQLLLDAGANVNAETTDLIQSWPSSGMSEDTILSDSLSWLATMHMKNVQPLHLAILNTDLLMVEILMDSGAVLSPRIEHISVVPFGAKLPMIDLKHLTNLQERAKHEMDRGWPVLNSWIERIKDSIEGQSMDVWLDQQLGTTIDLDKKVVALQPWSTSPYDIAFRKLYSRLPHGLKHDTMEETGSVYESRSNRIDPGREASIISDSNVATIGTSDAISDESARINAAETS